MNKDFFLPLFQSQAGMEWGGLTLSSRDTRQSQWLTILCFCETKNVPGVSPTPPHPQAPYATILSHLKDVYPAALDRDWAARVKATYFSNLGCDTFAPF